jgi:poly(3-hydroxybutyrate) depolymerase
LTGKRAAREQRVKERRVRVAQLTEGGWTVRQIADNLGVTHATVAHDRAVIAARPPRKKPEPVMPPVPRCQCDRPMPVVDGAGDEREVRCLACGREPVRGERYG